MITLITACSAGCLVWTFSEYIMHRYVGHKKGGTSSVSLEHQAHHRDPYHFTKARKKALTAAVVATILTPLSIFAFGGVVGATFTVGFFGRYLSYEVLHRRIHTHGPKPNVYSRWLRTHHLYHHFGNPRMNHGVTTPLWDAVFGTLILPIQVRIPARRIAHWMCDPNTGRLRSNLTEDYKLILPAS